MRTVVLGPPPAELAALIDKRRLLGIDRFDEVWEGEYHMAPAPHPAHGIVEWQLVTVLAPRAAQRGLIGTGPFNLGRPDDYRVPDAGIHSSAPAATFVDTAPLVVEVVSPHDETYAKFTFYAAHGVQEILVADPQNSTLRCYRHTSDGYAEADRSDVLDVATAELSAAITWPT